MFPAALLAEQRRNARAQLQLPVRLRWLGPLGSQLEITETLDVSRGGLLCSRAEPCTEGSRVWVTFPFDSDATVQTESPARIVRVEIALTGGYRIALRLEALAHREVLPVSRELRASPRVPLVMPIEIRAGNSPWPQEAMTLDVSAGGVLFETSRIYSMGETVLARLQLGPWSRAREFPARVVRVEMLRDPTEQRVAVVRGMPPLRRDAASSRIARN